MIKKIISGGQTGADRGGLLAGKLLGIETGGTAPPNFMTELGTCLELRDTFGLVEGEYDPRTYPKRTKRNIKDSDGTLLMGIIHSPGSRLTLRYCQELEKPWIINPTPLDLKEWLDTYKIEVLNVAGNRESKNPGIEKETILLLRSTLEDLRR